MGVQARSPKNQFNTTEQKKEIKRLYYQERLSIQQVASRLGSTYGTIQRIIQKEGGGRPPQEANRKAERKQGPGGYIYVWKPKHPKARHGRVPEHIHVWEEVHNKRLPKGYIVHHINGIKSDNRPSNLIALPKKKHQFLIPRLEQRIRELEAENRQLKRALEDSQMIFYCDEN